MKHVLESMHMYETALILSEKAVIFRSEHTYVLGTIFEGLKDLPNISKTV